MKLLGALIFSLLIHIAVIEWKPILNTEALARASKATLNIQQMRFVDKIVKPLNENKIESAISEKINESEEYIAERKVKELIDISLKEQVTTIEPQPFIEEIAIDETKKISEIIKKSKTHQPVEKHKEKIEKTSKKEIVEIKKKKEKSESEIKKQDAETAEGIKHSKNEFASNKVETDVGVDDVLSTTESIAEESGLDLIPTMSKPRYRKVFPPKYPRIAKKRGQQGLVLLRAKLNKNGAVMEIEVMESSGVKSLDTRALETVEKWLFHPYKIADHPVVAWVNIPVDFTLK